MEHRSANDIYTQTMKNHDFEPAPSEENRVNSPDSIFLQQENENMRHVQNTEDDSGEYRFDSGGGAPGHGQRTPADPLDETPRSLSPFDDNLNVFLQSNDANGQSTETFYQGHLALDVENEGLSMNIHLLNDRESRDSTNSSFENLEYSVNDVGQGEILTSGPPKNNETRNPMEVKWLHLQGPTMNLNVMVKHIMECHLIGDDVRAVTMTLMKKVGEKFVRHSETGPYIEPGAVLRGVGIYPKPSSGSLSQKYRPTIPVVFGASPYLRLGPLSAHRNSAKKDDHRPRTLLQNLYGFDIIPNRDGTQIVRKIGDGSHLDDVFHVNQMWCLLIGSTILITMSDHTTRELLDGTIGKRILSHETPIKIKIIDGDSNKYYDIAISSNTTWVDLFNITMDAVHKEKTSYHDYDLRDDKRVILTAERWIEIAKSPNSQKLKCYTFYLTRRLSNSDKLMHMRLLENGRPDTSGTTDKSPTRDRRSGTSFGSVTYSRRGSNIHPPKDQGSINVVSSPTLLGQDGPGIIMSSPDPQESGDICPTSGDLLQDTSTLQKKEVIIDDGIKTPLGINISPNNRESPQPSYVANPAYSKDDVTSNTSDIDEIIDLTETNKSQQNIGRTRSIQVEPGSEISVETFSSVQEDDRAASREIFPKQQFNNKHRQSQASTSSLISNQFSKEDAGYVYSNRDDTLFYYAHQRGGPRHQSLESSIIANATAEYPRRRDFANNGKKVDQGNAPNTGNRMWGAEPHSHHEKRDVFAKQAPTNSMRDWTNDKQNTVKLQESRISRTVPFFLWGPCIPMSSTTLRSAKEADMIKLLNEADKAISTSQLGIYYYGKIPELTEEDFLYRQDVSNGSSPGDLSIKRERPTHQHTGPMTVDNSVKGQGSVNSAPNTVQVNKNVQMHQEQLNPTEGVKQNNTGPERKNSSTVRDDIALNQVRSLGILSPDKELMEQLVEISRQILRSFTPKTGSSTVHTLLKRFWGCLDIIRLQLMWEESEREPHDVPTYIIRDFSAILQRAGRKHSPNSQKTLLSKCAACKGGKHYSSAKEALDHLHDEHLECHHKCQRPYDDPCYAWLHRIWHSNYPVRNERNDLLRNVQEFVKELSGILAHINELHAMVTSREDESMGDLAVRPPLPKEILHVFQKIVQVFVLRSKTLSFMTRSKRSSGVELSEISAKINELKRFEESAQKRILELLDDAKRDIFLSGNTSSDTGRPQLQRVGAELLALAFICKGHNLLFEPKASTSHHNENTLELYKHYTSELHLQANQRPQKRVFLDIRDLEEELDALDTLLSHQRDCLRKFAKSISPDTLRLTTMTRVAQGKVESAYKDNHTQQLDIRTQEIQNMKTRSRFLKEQVKQTIEIMEEDHGKAIRVFTIVTLFFLPLSFVSSFMGMNTADVRNMNHKQGLFWATGIPVTIFVLTMACIYGYKGDEIRDWVIQQSQCPKNNNSRLPVDGGGDGGGDKMYTCDVTCLPTTKKPRRAAHQRRSKSRKQPHNNEGDDGNEQQRDGIPPLEREETLNSLTLLKHSSGNGEV
ncbi:hypothetical protein TrVGV298_007900 [Trichoderma virens]|nr:hypothetical protein TrVGV298_007900 [Trichoderma virens]